MSDTVEIVECKRCGFEASSQFMIAGKCTACQRYERSMLEADARIEKAEIHQGPCDMPGLFTAVKAASFQKFDDAKPRYSLFPVKTMGVILKVLEYGARKYAPGNWSKCEEPLRYYDACVRHLEAWRAGEINDPETGLPHLAHACCCAIFLLGLHVEKP